MSIMLAPWLFAVENPMKESTDLASDEIEDFLAIESFASDLFIICSLDHCKS